MLAERQARSLFNGASVSGWRNLVRPSRRPRSLSSGRPKAGPGGGLLRMRFFLNVIKILPHPEERPTGASRRTHDAQSLRGFARCNLLAKPQREEPHAAMAGTGPPDRHRVWQ